jgi:hypothetical protein
VSTFVDGAPPTVSPDPEDDEPRDDTGPSWLQDEIRRRMAERSTGTGTGGRHARRDPAGEPPGGVEHVPRHSVATPGPGAPPPGPIGGPSLPVAGVPARRRREREPEADGSGDAPARPGRRVPQAFRPGARGVPTNAPATFGGPGFTAPATRQPTPAGPDRVERPVPERAEFGGPGFGAPATRHDPDRVERPEPDPRSPAGPIPDEDRGLPAGEPGPDPARPGRDDAREPRILGPAPAAPSVPVSPAGEDRSPRAAGAEVLPPRSAARLLAAPGGAETLGRPHPAGSGPVPQEPLDRTGPLPVGRPGEDTDDGDDVELPGPDDEDTVLWTAHVPPPVDGGTATASAALPVDVAEPQATDAEVGVPQRRIKVTLSERRNQAHPVRTVVDIQEGGAVGELLRSNLIGSQLTVALRFALFAGLTIGLLPLAFALFPEIGRVDVLGLRLPWLLLGVLVYPFLLGLGWWHTRTAERVEQNFADHVQD